MGRILTQRVGERKPACPGRRRVLSRRKRLLSRLARRRPSTLARGKEDKVPVGTVSIYG